MKEILRTQELSHIYSPGTPFEHQALDGINMTLYAGEFVGIIGHTGSGKSTFIQHLNGLLEKTSGQVLYEGVDIDADKEMRRKLRFSVGLVFQYPEYQLFEETVEKDIAFGPKNMGLLAGEVKARVDYAANLVGLSEKELKQSPFLLSGGQKRRAAIAGVLAMRPQVLILDEPTAGLDPKGREEILAHIETYQKEQGATIVMVSHSMEEIARLASRIIVFEAGKITLEGTAKEVFAEQERLRHIGLDLPEVAEIADYLRVAGLSLPEDIFTVDTLAAAILSQKK